VSKRNLVVIVADTWRDQRSVQNGGPPLMPFLEEFARDGVRLDRLLASSSWTAPSHVALLTGTDPWETHFQLPGAPKRPKKAESLADRWGKEGGVSAGFSGNFVVSPVLGTAPGYMRFNPGFPSTQAGAAQRAMQAIGYESLLNWAVEVAAPGSRRPVARAGAWAATWVGSGTCRVIGTLRSGPVLVRSVDKFLTQWRAHGANPLHIFMNLVESHEPYLVGDNAEPSGTPTSLANLPSINLARLTNALKPAGDPKRFLEAYRGSLRKVDEVFRGIVGALRRGGVLDNAVLMFLSDHGQSLGETGFYGHGYRLYDELVKVPGYLWEFRDGRPVPIPALPTEWIDHRHVFDLLSSATPDGAPLDPADVLSTSLLRRGPAASYFEGPVPHPPAAFARRAPPVYKVYRLLRVQQGDGSAVVSSDIHGGELEDVPTETRDPVLPELGEIGRQILSQIKIAPSTGSAEQAEMDAKVDERLKSWGYD
jgi:hypothetical protein